MLSERNVVVREGYRHSHFSSGLSLRKKLFQLSEPKWIWDYSIYIDLKWLAQAIRLDINKKNYNTTHNTT